MDKLLSTEQVGHELGASEGEPGAQSEQPDEPGHA
jgi:hypothetical protein